MKQLIIILLFTGLSYSLYAKDKVQNKMEHKHGSEHNEGGGHKHDGDHKMNAGLTKMTAKEAVIKVHGMVCAFCAQGIEKNFNKKKQVKATKVDLDKMEVTVTFKKGQALTEEKMKEVITGAGFEYKGTKYVK